jgi:hypothetical protein
MKTNELLDDALNWAVAKCLPTPKDALGLLDLDVYNGFNPSTDWAQGGPIIEREGITVIHIGEDWEDTWQARKGDGHWQGYLSGGQTPLIAAMRCYVASTLGVEVDIPEELTS